MLFRSIVPITHDFGPLDTAYTIIRAGSFIIVAMYPPVLILIINYGYSISDTVVQLGDKSNDSGPQVP